MAPSTDGMRYALYSPTAMPTAGGFLWNRRMMVQLTCRGYATAQFMQPEPAKYAHAPLLEARNFMMPEQPYYAHHPGRFFYLKDEDTGALYSVPHEPVRAPAEAFEFSAGKHDVRWRVRHDGIVVELCVSLPTDDAVELWECRVHNQSGRTRRLSLYPYFPIGYMSWMHQSGGYSPELGGIVCRSVTPYQRWMTTSVSAISRTARSCCMSSRRWPGTRSRWRSKARVGCMHRRRCRPSS